MSVNQKAMKSKEALGIPMPASPSLNEQFFCRKMEQKMASFNDLREESSEFDYFCSSAQQKNP